MKTATIRNATTLFVLGLGTWAMTAPAPAQTMYDRVVANVPYSLTIGQKTLPPGQYTFQQLQSAAGDSRVVLVYSDNGMKFQTSAMSIPTLDPNTAQSTKLILDQVGNNYYLSKIWVEGKDYGYEFPLPANVKSREKELQQASIAGTYSQAPANTSSSANNTNTNENTNTSTAQNTTPPPASTTENPPAPTESAQNTPPPQTAQPPAEQSTSHPTTEPSQPSEQGSADRSADQNNETKSMPHTSAGWLLTLLSGGALSGAGLSLRRRRR